MSGSFYSLAAARRSLGHFAGGKLLSAAVGIAYLLTTVRKMEPVDYGRYVAVLAMCEIFYLVTGLGLSTLAQRYVAEYRVRAVALEFRAFLGRALRRRFLYSVAFASVVYLLWSPLMRLTGLDLPEVMKLLVVALLVANAGVAYLEEVMGALLLQGYSQALAILRNVSKLGVLTLLLSAGAALHVQTVISVEAAVAVLSWLTAELLVRRWASRSPSAPGAQAGYTSTAMNRVILRFYLVQLTGQTYGASMIKLIVTRLLGATQTAAFGVAQSAADILRNYMPAHMLAAWIRPLMVSRYVANRDVGELAFMANLVFKLNLLGLLPAAVLFAVLGDPLMAWVTGGRYLQLGSILALLTVVVMMQTGHLLLGMITLTLEQPGISLRATIAAAATLPVLVVCILGFGIHGAAAALVLGETVWVLVAWVSLRRRHFDLRLDVRGTAKLVLAGALAGAAGWACQNAAAVQPWWVVTAAMALTFGLAVALFRPASAAEIAQVRRLLSARRPPATTPTDPS